MDTTTINKILSPLKIYGGCFARDEIPAPTHRPICYVVNLDKSSEGGSHWVSLFLDTNAGGEYYDPFGGPPEEKEIIDYINKHLPGGCRYNSSPRQSYDSEVCGQHAIAFVRMKALGRSICEIEIILSKTNARLADELVEKLL